LTERILQAIGSHADNVDDAVAVEINIVAPVIAHGSEVDGTVPACLVAPLLGTGDNVDVPGGRRWGKGLRSYNDTGVTESN
jgi:hypothetical protein